MNNIFHDIMMMLMMTDDCKEVLVDGLCNVPSFDSASEKWKLNDLLLNNSIVLNPLVYPLHCVWGTSLRSLL